MQSQIKNQKSKIRERGFSFAEVLFAVIVLGIGFIMIAAVFPVAITQSKATKEETTTAAVVLQGSQLLGQAGQWDTGPWTWYGTGQDQPNQPLGTRPWADQALPHTWPVDQPLPIYIKPASEESVFHRGIMKPISMRDGNPYVRKVAEMLRSSRIDASDPRFAWVAFYRRDVTIHRNPLNPNPAYWRESPASYAQVILIGVQSQGEGHVAFNTAVTEPATTDSDFYQGNAGTVVAPKFRFTNLDPRPVKVVIEKYVNDVVAKLTVTALQTGNLFYDSSIASAYSQMINAIAPGCFLVISSDQITDTANAGRATGRMNGRIYRVGEYLGQVGGNDQYNLSPDGDFEVDPGEDGILGNVDDIRAIGTNAPGSNITVNGPAIAFVIGKPMVNRSNVSLGFTGPIMDISAYSTFIQAK